MASPLNASGMGPDDEIAMEKNAGLIMGTNNSSIVSKRSVENLYLPQPHFYRYFVRKPQRRSPTINRGYWLRMRAIDWVVRQFLERSSSQRKVILNLGCGYDPIPFQWLAQYRETCHNTKFIDIDFKELMLSKREIILNTPKMNDLLSNPTISTDNDVLLDSEEYAAIGCDLRNPKRLERLIKTVVDIDQCLVLCLAEVSITYMSVDDSDALIAWSTTLSPDVTFCLLEQQSPDRADNPFTATMLKHFAKLGTPLRSVLNYPGCHTQILRFQTAGYLQTEVQNLWELWADPRFLSPTQRMSLDEVEPFDEWEEFALFASHYCLIVAQTGPDPLIPEQPKSRRASIDSFASDMSTRTVSPYGGKSQWFAYTYSQNPERQGRTHHASAFFIPNEDAIGIFGGIGQQNRLSTTSVYTSADNRDMALPVLPPEDIGARSCHTITTMGNGQNILVGGRASPSAPMRDCWLQTGLKWERIQDLPEPRFRHRACGVVLPRNKYGVVVYGGRTSATKVAIDVLLWDLQNGWQKLKSLRGDPMPRFGASFVRLGYNHGLLFGGMRQDGVICQGLWRWRLTIRDNVVAGISFKTSSALDTSAGVFPWLSRLGAAYSVIRNELLLIGGVAKQGCIPKDYEILSILGSFSAFGEYEKEMDLRVTCIIPKKDPDVPRPFLIGHSTHRTAKETTIIIGGGATCFSFGAYWNPGCWLLYDREAGVSCKWALLKPTSSTLPKRPVRREGIIHVPAVLDSFHPSSENDFLAILRDGKPRLLTGLDLGPCISLWTPSYLLSKISPSQNVVVHSAKSRTMNFQRKDFAYTTLTFHNFLKILQSNPDAHLYLRSLSSTNPTQSPAIFADDWPSIADDVHLDPSLDFIRRNKHSSPLRISANVNMWLHYDVMANVLFQIRGTRKLILFPPEDIKHLSFPPGSTTSTLDVLEPSQHSGKEEDQLKPIPDTHPYIAVLRPGEALFIPPLWSHTGTPLPVVPDTPATPASPSPTILPPQANADTDAANSHINISLNIFFRSLSPTKYPAGRDVYGNRDLAAYEDGRRDLDKLIRRFITTATNNNSNNHTTTSTSKVSKPEANPKTPNGLQDDGTNTKTPAKSASTEEKEAEEQKAESTTSPRVISSTTTTAVENENENDDEAFFAEGIPKALTKAYLERLADELRERADRL